MVKKFSLVFNNNIAKGSIINGGIHVSSSPGVLAAARFFGEFLAFIKGSDFVRDLFPLGRYGHRFRALFMVDEYDGKLLRDSVKKCVRMSAEISLVSDCNVAIKILFYESGKKQWYASFQINFSIDGGVYSGGGSNINILGNKTNFE